MHAMKTISYPQRKFIFVYSWSCVTAHGRAFQGSLDTRDFASAALYLDVSVKQDYFLRDLESFLDSDYAQSFVSDLKSGDFKKDCLSYQAMKDKLGSCIESMAEPFREPFPQEIVNSMSGYFIIYFIVTCFR